MKTKQTDHWFNAKFNFQSFKMSFCEPFLMDSEVKIGIWNLFQITPLLVVVSQGQKGMFQQVENIRGTDLGI